jgi:uncharacterized protein (TIGR02757 family)
MKGRLDHLYSHYNRAQYIHPDPLETVYRYETAKDREVVGMIASSFAFGRVSSILGTLSVVLGKMGTSPHDYLMMSDEKTFKKDFKGFVYRFVRGNHVVALLSGLKGLIRDYGSLEDSFVSGVSHGDETILAAQEYFVDRLMERAGDPGYLVARPRKGSAMKRMNLYLRWMVRNDDVDPGVWSGVAPRRLIVPLDTHMHAMARTLGFTERKQGDMRTALEITRAFSRLCPEDPVKYDFSLTRFGIRAEMDPSDIHDAMSLPG